MTNLTLRPTAENAVTNATEVANVNKAVVDDDCKKVMYEARIEQTREGVHKASEIVFSNEDGILSGKKYIVTGLPALGSKRCVAPLIYSTEKWLAITTGNEDIQVIDTCTGGGSLSVNGYFNKRIANDCDLGIMSLQMAIANGDLHGVLLKAYLTYEEALRLYKDKTGISCETDDEWREFATWFYKTVVEPFYKDECVVEPKVDIEVEPSVVGLYAVYGSHKSSRVSADPGDLLEFIAGLKGIVSIIFDSSDTQDALYKYFKKVRNNSRFKALFRYAYRICHMTDLELKTEDMFDILSNIKGKDRSKDTLLLVDMPYPSKQKNYINDGYFNFWHGVYILLIALLETQANFILFCDENCMDVFGGLQVFEDINFYLTEFKRNNDGIKEVIVTNFDLPEANYDTFPEDFKKLTRMVFNSRKDKWDYSNADFDEEKYNCLPYKKLENPPCRDVGFEHLKAFLKEGNKKELLKRANFGK